MAIDLKLYVESWEMKDPIVVSRGTYSQAQLVVVELTRNGVTGRGECCPTAHYGESVDSVCEQIRGMRSELQQGLSRQQLLESLPPGAARNGIDCALWDLECKQEGVSIWDKLGLQKPERLATAMTVVLGETDKMAEKAREFQAFSTLKLKLGPLHNAQNLRAVRAVRPDARLSIDPNEGWTSELTQDLAPVLDEVGIALIEQPLPAAADQPLENMALPAPLCADESFHSSADLPQMHGRYRYVNIKLDKCGGLTEALNILELAPKYDLIPMVGCMFGTSLAMAPALVVASQCSFVDLDAPLHFSADRDDNYTIKNGEYLLNSSSVWGG